MGCCSSKHPSAPPAKQRSCDPAAPSAKQTSARPAIAADDAYTNGGAEPATLACGWEDRTDELISCLLLNAVGDKALDGYIAIASDVAKNSYKERISLGSPRVVRHLCQALAVGPPNTAQLAAQALKLLTFCHQNHSAFMFNENLTAIPTLIKGLGNEDYRVSVCCLAALSNLSATPECLQHCVANSELLAALERVLLQKRIDQDPQANATQLLLNLCAKFTIQQSTATSDAHDVDSTITGPAELHVVTRNSTHWGTTSERCEPTRDSDAWTRTTDTSSHVHPAALRMHEGTVTQCTRTSEIAPGPVVPADPLPDCRELLSTVLRVLSDATALEREARENCIEVVLALLLVPGTTIGVNSKVAEHFVAQNGLTVIAAEACREGALASTLVLLSEILRLFARSHVQQLFRAPIVRAVAAMLSYVTKRGADERQVDVDVKLAGLSLVQLLHTDGEPLAGVVGCASAAAHSQLAHEVVHLLPACLSAPSVAVQLAACQLMVIYQQNPHARGALRGGDVVRRLVELNKERHPLTAAPAVHCVGIMSELHSDNADAVVRADGMHAMLCTLEEDCPAQAQRHALVSITKVLQRAHSHCLSPELQRGRMIPLAVSVLMHTAHSGVTSQAQWSAWCCRALRDAANVDQECAAKVASVMARKPEVLKLIGVSANQCTPAVVLPALARAAAPASGEFLAVVADLQVLEEAVSTQLIRGRHPMLSSGSSAPTKSGAASGPDGLRSRNARMPPSGGEPASSSHILTDSTSAFAHIGAAGSRGGLSQLQVTNLGRTQNSNATDATMAGSTQVAHDITDSSMNFTSTTARVRDVTGVLPEDRPAPDCAFPIESAPFVRARGGGGARTPPARSSLAMAPMSARGPSAAAQPAPPPAVVGGTPPLIRDSSKGSHRTNRSGASSGKHRDKRPSSRGGGSETFFRQRGAGHGADCSQLTFGSGNAHAAHSILENAAQRKQDDRSDVASEFSLAGVNKSKSVVQSERNISRKSGSQKDADGYLPPPHSSSPATTLNILHNVRS